MRQRKDAVYEDVTDAKVSERYDEHQSSTLLGDTKSTQGARSV